MKNTKGIQPVVIALILGVVTALVIKHAFANDVSIVLMEVAGSLFSTSMNLLKCVAGPLVFFAVLSGIYGIRDAAILGKIGKKLIGHYVLMTYVCAIIALFILAFMVKVDMGAYKFDGSVISSFVAIFLQFVPANIISPFSDSNMMQIIFLAILTGIGMIVISNKVSELGKIIDQLYCVIQLMMSLICKVLPFIVFFSMLSFVLSGNVASISEVVKPMIIVVIVFFIMLVVYGIMLKIRFKISIINLYKKLLPSFMIAFTTASSTAAYQTSIETCEKKLGISENVVKFGLPLGQVVYMPLKAAEYLAITMVMAEVFDVEITLVWIAYAVLMCGILAIATPPIPGGAIPIFTVLFTEFNIPISVLSIVISMDLVIDYLATAGDVIFVQEGLMICADKMGYLDNKILSKKNR